LDLAKDMNFDPFDVDNWNNLVTRADIRAKKVTFPLPSTPYLNF